MSTIKIIKDTRVGTDGFFTRILTEYLPKRSFSYPSTERTIHPSSITECTRRIVWDLLRLPRVGTIIPRIQRIFDNGNYVHKRYLNSYIPNIGCAAKFYEHKNGKLVCKDFIEKSLKNSEYWLKGTPDAVIINFEDGLPYIFELKSIRQELFMTMQQPDWGYMAQVHLYMFLTGIPRAIVFYESKNDQDVKEFLVLQDQSILDQLLQKIKLIQDYVQKFDQSHLQNSLAYAIQNNLPECECTKKYESCIESEKL
jgi:hypothetical protein